MDHKGEGLFYGWFIVGVCFVVNFIIFGISINTFTVYVKPIETDLGWSRDQVTLAMGLAPLAMGAASPFIGRLIDRIGARYVMAAGAAVIGVGSILLAKTESRLYFYSIYSIAGVGQAAATIIPISLVISNWFHAQRGKALGIVMTGTGLGAMVMVPVTTWIVVNWNWRTSYTIMGFIILLMVPLNLLFIRTRPSDMGLEPDGGMVSETKPVVLEGLSVSEAFGTLSFWLIAAMMLLSGLVAMGIGVNLMPYFTDDNVGHSPAMAAGIISVISFLTVVGKVGIGFIADRWGIQRAVVLAFSILIAGILLLMGARNLLIAYTFAVVYGFAIGTPLLINPALTAECVGLRNFGAIFGILTLVNVVGVAIGAYSTGVIYVKAGSYIPALWLFVGLMTIAAICGMTARRKSPELAA
jgi:MFS family permease